MLLRVMYQFDTILKQLTKDAAWVPPERLIKQIAVDLT